MESVCRCLWATKLICAVHSPWRHNQTYYYIPVCIPIININNIITVVSISVSIISIMRSTIRSRSYLTVYMMWSKQDAGCCCCTWILLAVLVVLCWVILESCVKIWVHGCVVYTNVVEVTGCCWCGWDCNITWITWRLKCPSRLLLLLVCVSQHEGSCSDVLIDAGVMGWCR